MASNQFIEDALLRHQIYLRRYAASAGNEVAELLEQLGDDLAMAIGSENTEFQAGQLRRISAELPSAIEALNLPEVVEREVEDLVGNEVKYFEALLAKSTTASIVSTSPETLAAVLSQVPMTLRTTTGKVQRITVAQLVAEFGDGQERQVLRALRTGVGMGKTNAEMAREIQRLTKTRTRAQALALVRTAVNHFGGEARKFATVANQDIFQGEKYVATLDSRTTFICASLDGDVYQVGNGPQPPLHYNCRSLRVPIVKDKYKIPGLEGSRGAVSVDDQGKRKTTQVSNQTKFESWFARQPASFRKDYLGPGRYELYRKGNLRIGNFVDNNGRVYTLRDLVKNSALDTRQ